MHKKNKCIDQNVNDTDLCVKLTPRDLKSDPYSSHPTSIYIYHLIKMSALV